MEKKKEKKEITKKVEPRINIRCRNCFVVDGYKKGEDKCRHCGAKIYLIDSE